MNVTTLPSVAGAHHRRKRVGRGVGSGHGKTSTRGQKGQRARTGSGKRPGFEGGRTPLIRRFPKRGFRDKSTGQERPTAILNLDQLNRFADGDRVTPERLAQAGLIRDAAHRVKLLGDGALSKRLTVAVHAASESAKQKLEQAGATLELLPLVAAASPSPKAAGHSPSR